MGKAAGFGLIMWLSGFALGAGGVAEKSTALVAGAFLGIFSIYFYNKFVKEIDNR